MTSTPDIQPLDGCDDPASVLGYARDRKRAAAAEEREVAKAAAKWLAMHATDSLVRPGESTGVEERSERQRASVTRPGDLSLGLHHGGSQHQLAWSRDAELVPRPAPRPPPRAARRARPARSGFVDAHVAPVAHKIGPAQLLRLVEEAKARFDPEQAEADRAAAAEARHVDIDLAVVGVAGTAHLDADLDLADAIDLEAAVADVARQLLGAGCTESLDVRRSMALGLLARGQLTLPTADNHDDSNSEGGGEGGGTLRSVPPSREVVLHAHISAAAVAGAAGTGGAVHRVPYDPDNPECGPTCTCNLASSWYTPLDTSNLRARIQMLKTVSWATIRL